MKKNNDEHRLVAERRKKLEELKKSGNAYRNDCSKKNSCSDLYKNYKDGNDEVYEIVGRLMSKRLMGKSNFAHVTDFSGKIQFYVSKESLPENIFNSFKHCDIGDIVKIEGNLFKTQTDEITINCKNFIILTKSLRPLPEKFHGLSDQEIKYRKRYLDLLFNEGSIDTFKKRTKIISCIRKFFDDNEYYEVETPMMQKIPGGAKARPFITHHNTLDLDLYLRIAPELYLKRLIVGGYEKVYEMNRSFRNEGISSKHNPEFTMLEFYQAYATYNDLMKITENLLKYVSKEVLGTTVFTYQNEEIDFGNSFSKMTLKEALIKYNDSINKENIEDENFLKNICKDNNFKLAEGASLGEIQFELFEKTVEQNLIIPTFITEYPVEVSPLARVNNDNNMIADRFEFFVAGKEIANGFSELNDPDDQKLRFMHQSKLKEDGDFEAMHFDEEYIEALEYGMPPTAGEGIGIDRLVMLLTDSPSIRDVLLFPLLR